MREFRDDENNPVQTLRVERSCVQRGGVYFHASRGYHAPSDQLPAILVEALEAAGVECGNDWDFEVDHSTPGNAGRAVSSALWNLKRAAAIREYHAKPRVTPAQVQTVADALRTDRMTWSGSQPSIYEVLQAALDSGVLVPADNKEVDRG